MLIITHIHDADVGDALARCKTMAAINHGLAATYENHASKSEALKRARLYESMWKGLDLAIKERDAQDSKAKMELKALAEKHGASAVIAAIQQCFDDDEVQKAVDGFGRRQRDVETV